MIYINECWSNGTGDIQWRVRGFNVSQTARTFLSSRPRYISVRLRVPICLFLAHYAITFPSSVTASSPSLIFSRSLAAQLGDQSTVAMATRPPMRGVRVIVTPVACQRACVCAARRLYLPLRPSEPPLGTRLHLQPEWL